jgi:hypothetical protein
MWIIKQLQLTPLIKEKLEKFTRCVLFVLTMEILEETQVSESKVSINRFNGTLGTIQERIVDRKLGK